ncbi:hypothetical protein AB990_04585 [Alkalihalobacillus pseudalcaliphilus]|nr:hypothetical protein AB990_04585 [Alkalihalobacillus pseudalcaliphilus]
MVSLDGYVEDQNGNIDWSQPDEDVFHFILELEKRIDTHIYGRKTYENMAAYWPNVLTDHTASKADKEWANMWVNAQKIVFTRASHVSLQEHTRIATLMEEELIDLKKQRGQAISLGGASIAETFMEEGYIDEFQLFIFPLLLGSGKPMFPIQKHTQKLKLVETKTFNTGVQFLHYAKN